MHERNRKRAAQIAGKTPDIRTMIQEGQPKARMTQDEYDVKCLNAMVGCNWSFKQFSVGSFRELLDMGHGFEVPTPKIMKAVNDTTCDELSDRLYESHSIHWNWKENHIACLAH